MRHYITLYLRIYVSVLRLSPRYKGRRLRNFMDGFNHAWTNLLGIIVATDEYSGSLDHTCWSVRIHAHRYILTRESSSRIWRETAFDRSSIVLSICRVAKGLWYNRKSTFLSSNSFSADCNRFAKVSCIIETIGRR